MMEAFLNERSLHSQFQQNSDFSAALIRLNALLVRLAELQIDKNVFFDRLLYHRPVVQGHIFSSCLERITETSVRQQFKTLLRERLNARQWRDERIHTDGAYVCSGDDICESSVAELAERTATGRVGCLLSFSPSTFSGAAECVVQKELDPPVNVASVSNNAQWITFFRSAFLGVVIYDTASIETPRDDETVLSRRSRFHRTTYRNQGRVVYLDRESDCYWCVDNEHFGGAAHLEVFDSNGDHVGEALLDGRMRPESRDPTKHLTL